MAETGNNQSVIVAMANRYEMKPDAFEHTLRNTVVPAECSREQFAAFLLVAKEYKLNPITKEIYAFPSKNGIQPIVSIDGWMNLINSHPMCDGFKTQENFDDEGNLFSVTATIYRKDRTHPVEVTEYLSECKRGTDPWKRWPARMLRHKALIQAARYAFGFAGIVEPDEYERMEKPVNNNESVIEGEVVSPKSGVDRAKQAMKDRAPRSSDKPAASEPPPETQKDEKKPAEDGGSAALFTFDEIDEMLSNAETHGQVDEAVDLISGFTDKEIADLLKIASDRVLEIDAKQGGNK